MKDDFLSQSENPYLLLFRFYINLLNKFKKYNSKGKNISCSYMSEGCKYENELLVIGRQPSYWRGEFSPAELIESELEYLFKAKVQHPAIYGLNSLCPLSYVIDLWGDTENRRGYHTLYNSNNDPFWCCVKEVIMNLGICRDQINWPSCIALTYLYKISICNKQYLLNKPKRLQIDLCRQIFQIEISLLKPKRVLFLAGVKEVQDFLGLSNCSNLQEPVCSLGEYDFGNHQAQTVISINRRNYPRDKLVNLILERFRNNIY